MGKIKEMRRSRVRIKVPFVLHICNVMDK
jgi:hypothetical protein